MRHCSGTQPQLSLIPLRERRIKGAPAFLPEQSELAPFLGVSPCSYSKIRALARLLRYAQSLSNCASDRRQRAFLGWAMGNHAVVMNSNRQLMPGVGPAQRATSAVMTESTGVTTHRTHPGTPSEVQAADGPMMRYTVHWIVITGGTRYVERADPILRKKADSV